MPVAPFTPPTSEPVTARRAAATPFLNTAEAMDLCSSFGVAVASPDEQDIWNALFDTEIHLASNSPQAAAFLGSWRSAESACRGTGACIVPLWRHSEAPHS